jgi:hypothetical protein
MLRLSLDAPDFVPKPIQVRPEYTKFDMSVITPQTLVVIVCNMDDPTNQTKSLYRKEQINKILLNINTFARVVLDTPTTDAVADFIGRRQNQLNYVENKFPNEQTRYVQTVVTDYTDSIKDFGAPSMDLYFGKVSELKIQPNIITNTITHLPNSVRARANIVFVFPPNTKEKIIQFARHIKAIYGLLKTHDVLCKIIEYFSKSNLIMVIYNRKIHYVFAQKLSFQKA